MIFLSVIIDCQSCKAVPKHAAWRQCRRVSCRAGGRQPLLGMIRARLQAPPIQARPHPARQGRIKANYTILAHSQVRRQMLRPLTPMPPFAICHAMRHGGLRRQRLTCRRWHYRGTTLEPRPPGEPAFAAGPAARARRHFPPQAPYAADSLRFVCPQPGVWPGEP